MFQLEVLQTAVVDQISRKTLSYTCENFWRFNFALVYILRFRRKLPAGGVTGS